ncbi:MAG: hypothetical protein ACLTDF_12690 [Coprococcus sp.]
MNSLKNSALDRLRDPDNYKYLEKRWYSGTDITNTEYELDFRRKLRAEASEISGRSEVRY